MTKFRTASIFKISLLLLVATSIVSCVAPQWTVKNIQFCLTEEKDVKYLKDLLRTIAINENLDYLDGSERQYDFLSESKIPAIKSRIAGMRRDKYIWLSVITLDEKLGIYASNYDPHEDQVMLVVGGLDPKLAIPLTNRVEAILQKDWKLHVTRNDETNYALNCEAQ